MNKGFDHGNDNIYEGAHVLIAIYKLNITMKFKTELARFAY